MIKFKKLKVKGFKSFVEPTEVIIEQGLTGIVGPNGCGKSNLVEAFRFVMGELSPKQMRGSELDDVILMVHQDVLNGILQKLRFILIILIAKHQAYLIKTMKLK